LIIYWDIRDICEYKGETRHILHHAHIISRHNHAGVFMMRLVGVFALSCRREKQKSNQLRHKTFCSTLAAADGHMMEKLLDFADKNLPKIAINYYSW
jgi:hypothetical protein